VALVQAKWQAQGGTSAITSISMVGGDVTVNPTGFPTADNAGIVSAMGCTASPCQGVTTDGTTWTPPNAGTCTVTYAAGTGTVTANNTLTNCQ
jgi:hypothetical protein